MTLPTERLARFLATCDAPERCSRNDVVRQLETFLPVLHAAIEQAAIRERELQLVALAASPRDGTYEGAFQRLRAVKRLAGELAVTGAQLAHALAEFDEDVESIRRRQAGA